LIPKELLDKVRFKEKRIEADDIFTGGGFESYTLQLNEMFKAISPFFERGFDESHKAKSALKRWIVSILVRNTFCYQYSRVYKKIKNKRKKSGKI
jgi:hypothetical protein